MQLNEQTISTLGLQFGVAALICCMGFIVYDLAKQSKAGRYGTMVMFSSLGMGAVGFIIKTVLTKLV
ncbi:DUF2788 domain-containing protein [Leeia aquatica]|uniref:DUF2788 domain-containing protein n=1 Tax=Leeia aquatica TaxID=2725557 RepID=A0A847S6A5_9NEIS|nr:DUF2788 domain-containing protein [Leeia aquatica]NLR75414.1 DUF2788 domain-containing protein [Leeia aquatica]